MVRTCSCQAVHHTVHACIINSMTVSTESSWVSPIGPDLASSSRHQLISRSQVCAFSGEVCIMASSAHGTSNVRTLRAYASGGQAAQ